MKRFIALVMFGCFSLMLAQDAAGTYKLTGTNVRYTSLLRQTSTVYASDVYGIGVGLPLITFGANEPAGQILNGPFNESNLQYSGAFLNVTFAEDGTGTINEGSYYPTIELDEETCISSGAALPITDELVYTSNLTPSNYVQTQNFIGLESLSPFAGQFIGGISLSQSEELDFFSFGQSAGAFGGVCQAGFNADGTPCDASVPGNSCAIYEACATAGYASKGHTIETIPNNGVRDMYVEWHAVDGPLSQSGFGDDVADPCEDDLCVANQGSAACTEADGSVSPACSAELEAFDRILGVPGLPSTIMNPDCGFGEYIVGGSEDVGAGLGAGVQGQCQAGFSGDADANGYPDVVDGCFAAAAYGDPNAATTAFVGACTQLGFDVETCTALAGLAQAEVESTFICYDFVSHEVDYTVTSEADCVGATQIWTAVAWDCYGLLGLTYQSEDLCAAAAGAWVADCVLGDGLSRQFNVLNPDLAPWGGFLTWNSVMYSQCAAAGGGDTCNAYLVPDSGAQFDPACLADGDSSDCSGRLLMEMDPLCVPTLDVREVYIDFDEIDDCAANGDVTLDDNVNILDVVNLVQVVLGNASLNDNQICNADVNQDGTLNILDIVAIVQLILGGGSRTADASMVEILNNNNIVTIEADGYVGAVQMTLSHGSNFSIELTNDAFVAQSYTDGNQTKLMVVNPGNELFTAEGEFEIIETIAANGSDYIDVINPNAISLSDAYPNPFNPTTSFNLEVGNSGHVTMNVYNLMGQVVGTLVNNTMDAGNYNITWDATNFSSGMYIVKAETVNGIASQKVMLVK